MRTPPPSADAPSSHLLSTSCVPGTTDGVREEEGCASRWKRPQPRIDDRIQGRVWSMYICLHLPVSVVGPDLSGESPTGPGGPECPEVAHKHQLGVGEKSIRQTCMYQITGASLGAWPLQMGSSSPAPDSLLKVQRVGQMQKAHMLQAPGFRRQCPQV